MGRLPAKAFVILAVILRHFRHSERKHQLKTASHGKLDSDTCVGGSGLVRSGGRGFCTVAVA